MSPLTLTPLVSGSVSVTPALAASQIPEYLLTSNGTTVAAYNSSGLVVTGTDGAAVLAAILPAAGSAGAKIDFRNDGNVFPWSSVPALPKSISGRLVIDLGGATVQLSANGPRFLDFKRIADYDTFQNIEVCNGVIDANNVGGRHHVILGTYAAGANQQRVNLQSIYVHDIRAINVLRDPNTSTNHRLGIWLVTSDPGGGSATTLNDILIERVRVEGGNAGLGVGSASSTNLTSCDRVTFRDCWHDTGTTPTAAFGSSNYQIGGYASVGHCAVENCYGANSADVGVEIDNAISASVRGCEFVDAWNAGIFACNFTATPSQEIRIRDCVTKKVALGFGNTSANGIRLGGNSADNKIGSVVVEGCTHVNTSQSMVMGDAFLAYSSHPTGGYESTVLRDCKAYISGFNQDVTAAGLNAWSYVVGAPSSTTHPICVEGLYAEFNITRGAGSTQTIFYGTLAFEGGGTFVLGVSDVRGSFAQSGEVSTSCQLLRLAVTGVGANYRGNIRRIGPLLGTALGRIGIRVNSGPTYQHLDIEECELGNSAASSEFSFATTTDKGLVHLRGNRYVTTPAPIGLTGLVTATGKRLDTGWDAIAIFTQGSGAGITSIDFSTDGGTTYTNLDTQASGALPGNYDGQVGPLSSDALIKVTFATTQPTITLVPVNP